MAMCNLVTNVKVKPSAVYVMIPFALFSIKMPMWLFKKIVTCEIETVRK